MRALVNNLLDLSARWGKGFCLKYDVLLEGAESYVTQMSQGKRDLQIDKNTWRHM